MKSIAKLYREATTISVKDLEDSVLPLEQESGPDRDARIIEERRRKESEVLAREEWLSLPYTRKFLSQLEQEEVRIYSYAKSLASSSLADSSQATKKLIELETIEKVYNLMMKGNYARTTDK